MKIWTSFVLSDKFIINTLTKLKIFASGFIIFIIFLPHSVLAAPTATLYFLPKIGNYKIGQIFQVKVMVNTNGQAINAIESTIDYSDDTLQATSLSRSNLISLWAKEPSYNNSHVNFSGGIPSPGFTGTSNLLTINFKAVAEGEAWLKFTNPTSVLANDGYGTDILSSTGTASFKIQLAEKQPTAPPITPPPTVGEPQIMVSSPTHPDQNRWVANQDIIFNWQRTKNVTNFSYVLDHNSETIPDNYGEGLVITTSYLSIDDGIWYFHIKGRANQSWGPVTHYRVQIDASPPYDFKIISEESIPTANPSPRFRFEAKDDLSGIDRYEIAIDQSNWLKTTDNSYQVQNLSVGRHNLMVRAIDRAENSTEQQMEIEISTPSGPQITYWTKRILYGESFVAKGRGVPESKINLYVFNNRGQILDKNVQASINGNWLIEIQEPLMRGQYKFSVTQELPTGITSPASPKEKFEVLTNAIKIFGWILPKEILLWLIILLIIVILFLTTLILIFYRSFAKRNLKLKDLLNKK